MRYNAYKGEKRESQMQNNANKGEKNRDERQVPILLFLHHISLESQKKSNKKKRIAKSICVKCVLMYTGVRINDKCLGSQF